MEFLPGSGNMQIFAWWLISPTTIVNFAKIFGFEKSKLITRIAFVDFDGETALKYFYNRNTIDEDFLDQCCPDIKEGVTKLLKWLKNY